MVKWWRLPSVLLLWFFFSSTGRCSLGNMSDSHGCSGSLVLRLHPLTSSILLLLSTQGSGKPPATPRMPPWVTTQKTLSCEYICGRVGVGVGVCFVVRDNTPLPGRCVVFVTLNTSDDHLLWSAFGSLTQWRHIPHQSVSSIYATVRSSSADKHIHSRTNLLTSSEQLVMCHHVASNRPHWI